MIQLATKKFTPRQIAILRGMRLDDVVQDKRVLNKLRILGVVRLHSSTGKTSQYTLGQLKKAWYVNSIQSFEVVGVGKFTAKYFPGCGYPFVERSNMIATSAPNPSILSR